MSERLSTVVHRITLDDNSKEVPVPLAHVEKYRPGETPPTRDLDALSELFLARRIPLPEVEQRDETLLQTEYYVVKSVVCDAPGPGRRSLHGCKYRLRLEGYGSAADLNYRAGECTIM